MRIGRIKSRIPYVGRIDARGALVGGEAKAKGRKGRGR